MIVVMNEAIAVFCQDLMQLLGDKNRITANRVIESYAITITIQKQSPVLGKRAHEPDDDTRSIVRKMEKITLEPVEESLYNTFGHNYGNS